MLGPAGADGFRTMVEAFAIYALLLAGWGMWRHDDPAEPPADDLNAGS